jgi:hypothetical protein
LVKVDATLGDTWWCEFVGQKLMLDLAVRFRWSKLIGGASSLVKVHAALGGETSLVKVDARIAWSKLMRQLVGRSWIKQLNQANKQTNQTNKETNK